MAGNPDCMEEGYNMHICALKANGFDTGNPDKLQEITENPQYKCDNCPPWQKEVRICVSQ